MIAHRMSLLLLNIGNDYGLDATAAVSFHHVAVWQTRPMMQGVLSDA